MLILAAVLALYLAFNLGANDVANAMGTSVGAKAITLGQAIVLAGILEFSGAVLLGHEVSNRLVNGIVDPMAWSADPEPWLWAMLSVLLTAGLWLNAATVFGLPVSASHTVVGALAGVGLVAAGPEVVNWPVLQQISLAWVVTPLVSGAIAAIFYAGVRQWILMQEQPIIALREWIPWLAVLLFAVFGAIVFPALGNTPLARLPIPEHDLWLGLGAVGAFVLTRTTLALNPGAESSTPASLSRRGSGSGQFVDPLEKIFGRFQVVSACFVAFAHGANDVGNAVAPMGAIAYFLNTGALPGDHFEMPLWILVLGGLGIVLGLAILGKRVIATVGENIIALQPSSGFCAEMATATTVLMASRLGLPVSTSHALVGAVVGVGWVKLRDWRAMELGTLRAIALTWVVTIPAAGAIAAILFLLGQWVFQVLLT